MGRTLCLAVLLTACGSDPSGPGGGGDDDAGAGEPAALSGITAAHNAVRADVGVAGMTWNADLATLATGFIADCQFAHSSGNERSNVAGFEYVGENLYASGGGGSPTGQEITDAWASEISDYDYASNSCSGTCGHYTQIVWADSTDLGCAVKDCGGMFIVSCEYGPGGNFVGQRPY
jgi:pathogenesis-related protein 1